MKFKNLLLFLFILLISSTLVKAQLNLTELGKHTFNDRLTEVLSYVDDAGQEYAIVGLENGVAILEVTNPKSIQQLIDYPLGNSLYRDIQVYNDHAYIADESGTGLSILDLRDLPNTAPLYLWKGDGTTTFTNGHNIIIQDDGTAFVLGARPLADGALVLDLNNDPLQPEILGQYGDFYIDNAFIRNDTLYAAQIFEGTFSILDFREPNNPQLLAIQPTPAGKTHSCWLDDSGDYLFVIDEFPSGSLTAFDIQNFGDIQELGSYRSNRSENSMIHQLALIDNTLVIAHYTDGVSLVDVSYPEVLVEVGYFDTTPLEGSGLRGCWGIDPFLPSGNILVADKEEGLFILCPNYIQAAYLEGNITDASTGSPLFNVNVQLRDERGNTTSNLFGTYATGVEAAGSYDISFVRSGYCTITQENVQLQAGEVLQLDIAMQVDDGSCTSDTIVSTSEPVDTLTKCDFIFTTINENDFLTTSINISPNPTNGIFYVTLDENTPHQNEPYLIHIYDINGRLLMQKQAQTSTATLELPNATPTGIYLVEILTKQGSWTKKLVFE